ncbi:hypothetical protein D0Z07_1190 [Hyphodiscus hymeniophilus]|uniref:Hydrophobin n=1 Tax=Hyphodiscus hymeniophilus TaxID=353542 RepID=A0A9P6VPZ7_9HELO|nr:hypothetical protein D0Z07_1190 [Hyphodiscus hymeniophilus]
MRLYSLFVFVISPYLATAVALAAPFGDITSPKSPNLELEARDPDSRLGIRNTKKAAPSICAPQNPIQSNVCSSGSPYCCSGEGSGMVCGPASTTTCTSTIICCINNNGVSYADLRWRGRFYGTSYDYE